jgi:hypothetical protein
MKEKNIAMLISILTLTTVISVANVKASSTTLYVDPPSSTVALSQIFQINISISQVTDLAGWDFKLYYENRYLNATQILEGPFLKKAGQTSFWIVNFTDDYNATHGKIWASCASYCEQGSGANGTGVLATISFKAKLCGYTILHLAETDLIDSKMPIDHITHTTIDGSISIGKVGDFGGGVPPTWLNFDGVIDWKDLFLFRDAYLYAKSPLAWPYVLADLGGGVPPEFFTFDDIIDWKDLYLFRQCYLDLGP